MKTAIFLYDRSGIMAKPWLEKGYRCVLIDGQHKTGISVDPDQPLLHKWGMWIDALNDKDAIIDEISSHYPGVELAFGFPPCDHLAVSGARWMAGKIKAQPDIQKKALANALLVKALGEHYNCPWAFENPVSVISTMYRPPDFYFSPFEYGGWIPESDAIHPEYPDYIAPRDAYPKKTGIWCGNGFKKPMCLPVKPESGFSKQYKMLGGKSLKTKNIRSATPRGFALAVSAAHEFKSASF